MHSFHEMPAGLACCLYDPAWNGSSLSSSDPFSSPLDPSVKWAELDVLTLVVCHCFIETFQLSSPPPPSCPLTGFCYSFIISDLSRASTVKFIQKKRSFRPFCQTDQPRYDWLVFCTIGKVRMWFSHKYFLISWKTLFAQKKKKKSDDYLYLPSLNLTKEYRVIWKHSCKDEGMFWMNGSYQNNMFGSTGVEQ